MADPNQASIPIGDLLDFLKGEMAELMKQMMVEIRQNPSRPPPLNRIDDSSRSVPFEQRNLNREPTNADDLSVTAGATSHGDVDINSIMPVPILQRPKMTRSVMIKRFGQVLTGGALDWYASLPLNLLESFADLVDKFQKSHTEARKADKRMEDIFNIKQRRDETLQEFVHRFQRHRNTLPQIEDKWAGIAFRHALHPDGTLRRERYDPYYSRGSCEGTRRNNQYRHRSPPAAGTSRGNYNTRAPKLTNYNFCVSTSEVVAVLDKLGNRVKWPGKIKSDPSKRNLEYFCEFHKGHGHKTEDCHALRLAVADLLEHGHLTELLSKKGKQAYYRNREQRAPPPFPKPKQVVNFITSGADINIRREVQKNNNQK
ncbi:uncharacterized protein LOC132620011 [Lycium barbarum]|uniref:uncharacterized protein LOC132620011 n=1 Tax=Lycium barbarum TaxID=112863 RepID=UPI00293EF37D|nr:uncharacterized protein LOC132620011 [Lycium barbarum]